MLVQELVKRIARSDSLQECEASAYEILMNSLQRAHDFVEQQSLQENIAVDNMQSTLLVFLAVPLDPQHVLVASVQVGDGALFALQPNNGKELRHKWRWLQQPQIQASGNEVQPFMRTNPDIWRNYLKCDLLNNATFIMGMTDGTADDIEPPRPTQGNENPDPFFFVNDFYQHIDSNVLSDAQPAQALMRFLAYKKKQSYDDRTVICLYR
jgi:hypothetical protein